MLTAGEAVEVEDIAVVRSWAASKLVRGDGTNWGSLGRPGALLLGLLLLLLLPV